MKEKRIIDRSSDEAFKLMIESKLKYKFLFFKSCTKDILKNPKTEKEILEAQLRFYLQDEDIENREYFKNILNYSYSIQL